MCPSVARVQVIPETKLLHLSQMTFFKVKRERLPPTVSFCSCVSCITLVLDTLPSFPSYFRSFTLPNFIIVVLKYASPLVSSTNSIKRKVKTIKIHTPHKFPSAGGGGSASQGMKQLVSEALKPKGSDSAASSSSSSSGSK